MKTRTLTLLLAAAIGLASCQTSRQSPAPPAPAPNPGTGTAAPPNPNPMPPPPPPATPVALVVPPPAPPPAAAVPEQPPAPAPAAAPARPHQDLVQLKQAGLSDEFLLNKIRTDNVNYQLSTADILELRAAGLSETILEAMLRSGQPAAATAGAPVARKGEFAGLSRVTKAAFGVFGTSTKNVGRLVVDGDAVSWFQPSDPKDNFSLYVKNVKEIFNTCVLRPGQNLCLEFGIATYTGEEYRFRDPGWKNGDNRLILDATEYFRQAFPNLFFSQRAVNKL